MSRYVVGVCLAPPGEPAAIVAVRLSERVEPYSEYDEQLAVEGALLTGTRSHRSHRGEVKRRERLFDVVHLDRLPPGASYKRVAAVLAELLAPHSPLYGAPLVANRGYVGDAAVDELRAAGLRPGTWTVTPGDTHEPGRLAAPDLVALLAVLLQEQRLRVAAALPLAPLLADELKGFETRPGLLAAALAVACWRGERVFAPEDWATVRAS